MKNNNISFVIFSTFMITACGGGNNNTSIDSIDKTDNQIWSVFLPYQYKENSESHLKTIVEHQQTTFVNGKGYSKMISGLNLNYLDQFGEPPVVAVTNDNLYKSGMPHSVYGDYIANFEIKNISPDQLVWIQKPISATSKPATLEHTITWNVIDLSNKKVQEYLDQNSFFSDIEYPEIGTNVSLWDGIVRDPYKITYAEFYEKVKDNLFPDGSKCLQLQKIENNQEYFYLNNFPHNSSLQNNLENNWKMAAKDSTYTFNNLQGMQGYLKYIGNTVFGYTLIQGNYYEIYHYNKLEFLRDKNTNSNDCSNLNDIAASVLIRELE